MKEGIIHIDKTVEYACMCLTMLGTAIGATFHIDLLTLFGFLFYILALISWYNKAKREVYNV